MARFPEELVERLKREVPLAALCSKHGVELKAHGNDLIGLCPFHADKDPSFVVTPSKNLWNCLGACGRGGSNVDFVMKTQGISFRHAIELLQREIGAVPEVITLKTRQGTEHPILAEGELSDEALLSHVVEFYHRSFMNDPKAMQYLQKRGCFHPDAINRFKIGYANRTLGYRVPDTTAAGKKLKAQLQRIGILRETGHEHLSGCVVFPVYESAQVVGEIYGRRITPPVRDAQEHLYLKGPHCGVWNVEGLVASRQWLLCEAAIDALSFWCHGFHNVTWSYGVNGFTQDHWKLLREVKPEKIVICYDNDEAGNRAANELAQQLEPEGVEAWRVELKPRSDINDLVRSSKDPKAELAAVLAKAERLLPAPQFKVPSSTFKVEENQKVPSSGSEEAVPLNLEPETRNSETFCVSADGKQASFVCGERSYRVRGLESNTSFDHLKINLRFQYRERFHLDTFDLYNARQRAAFTGCAHDVTACDKAVIESDLCELINHLEKHQEKQILLKMKVEDTVPGITPEEESKALALLREPKLFDRILADFATVGTVGEDSNKLLGYLIAVSRKLDDPLSGLIVARSAAGKSSLLNAILDFVPEEDKEVMTAMTAQALFYLPKDGLKHKVLAVVEDEGSQSASYPLKILQSEKKLVLAVTVKDPQEGMPQTQLKEVDGPAAQFMTSTQAEHNYELLNRYLVLTVNEDREQTRRIHEAQREAETLQGMFRKLDREAVLRVHHNAQRLLRPLRVINPYVGKFNFPDDRLRLRRDHKKYLLLIRTVAFLRQYQKPIKSCEYRGQAIQYIEVDLEDIRLAHALAVEVMGQTLDDLAPPTRSFLLALHAIVLELEKERQVSRNHLRLSRREIRERIKWSVTQVREHLEKLVELEYVVSHRMPGTGTRYTYELVYDGQGQNGDHFIPHLPELTMRNVGISEPDVGSKQANVG